MSQSENTKQKLINSAIKIFAEKGFWKAKVSDIVNHAGVAQGTFYIYFKSKEDCLKKVLLILHDETISIMHSMFKNKSDLFEIINFFIKRIFQFKDIAKVFLFEAVASGEEFRKLYFEFKYHFREILQKFNLNEEKITIISGVIIEIIEQDILYENKDFDKVVEKLKKILIGIGVNGIKEAI